MRRQELRPVLHRGSLRTWLDATAHYPQQLAEAERSAYLEAKRERL